MRNIQQKYLPPSYNYCNNIYQLLSSTAMGELHRHWLFSLSYYPFAMCRPPARRQPFGLRCCSSSALALFTLLYSLLPSTRRAPPSSKCLSSVWLRNSSVMFRCLSYCPPSSGVLRIISSSSFTPLAAFLHPTFARYEASEGRLFHKTFQCT